MSLAERRAKKGLRLPSALACEDNATQTCSTPPPVRKLKSHLPAYEGEDLEHLQTFVRNKAAFLTAKTLDDSVFEVLASLGEGDGRHVDKVRHRPSGLVLARKRVLYDGKEDTFKVLINELDLLHNTHSPHVVDFYGSYVEKRNVSIVMEYMDGGSLEHVLKRSGKIEELALAHVCKNILEGLLYLERQNIMHRDLKPANILCNTDGAVKLADFGVSTKLQTTRAHTFVGTLRYMAPERLQGKPYTTKSDVWSLGLLLVELATGTSPYGSECADDTQATLPATLLAAEHVSGNDDEDDEDDGGSDVLELFRHANPIEKNAAAPSVFDVIQSVVNGPPPKLPETKFSKPFQSFVAKCLTKKPKERASLSALANHEWLTVFQTIDFDLAAWVKKTL